MSRDSVPQPDDIFRLRHGSEITWLRSRRPVEVLLRPHHAPLGNCWTSARRVRCPVAEMTAHKAPQNGFLAVTAPAAINPWLARDAAAYRPARSGRVTAHSETDPQHPICRQGHPWSILNT
jgi:hypothetical protein